MTAAGPAGPVEADRARALELTAVPRETLARLDRFADLLVQWQKTINLVSPATLPQLWTRHIADSLQLLALAKNPKVWVDLGSGGGFPGLPVAAALADVAGAEVHLVESNRKKAAFLREAVRITGVPAKVHAMRIDDFVAGFPAQPDVVSARALAPLKELLDAAYPLLKTGVVGLFPKGQDVAAELTEASKYWKFDHELIPSLTSPEGQVVVIRNPARIS